MHVSVPVVETPVRAVTLVAACGLATAVLVGLATGLLIDRMRDEAPR